VEFARNKPPLVGSGRVVRVRLQAMIVIRIMDR
jgi:hypothetical protein